MPGLVETDSGGEDGNVKSLQQYDNNKQILIEKAHLSLCLS